MPPQRDLSTGTTTKTRHQSINSRKRATLMLPLNMSRTQTTPNTRSRPNILQRPPTRRPSLQPTTRLSHASTPSLTNAHRNCHSKMDLESGPPHCPKRPQGESFSYASMGQQGYPTPPSETFTAAGVSTYYHRPDTETGATSAADETSDY